MSSSNGAIIAFGIPVVSWSFERVLDAAVADGYEECDCLEYIENKFQLKPVQFGYGEDLILAVKECSTFGYEPRLLNQKDLELPSAEDCKAIEDKIRLCANKLNMVLANQPLGWYLCWEHV